MVGKAMSQFVHFGHLLYIFCEVNSFTIIQGGKRQNIFKSLHFYSLQRTI